MVRDEWLARARLEGEAGRHRWANAEGIMGASRFGQDARNYRLEAGSTPGHADYFAGYCQTQSPVSRLTVPCLFRATVPPSSCSFQPTE